MKSVYNTSSITSSANELKIHVGVRVRDLRLSRGMSMRQVEAAGGPHSQTLMHIEHGKANPTMRTMKKLARAMGFHPATLFEPVEGDKRIRRRDAFVYGLTDEEFEFVVVKLRKEE